MTLSAMYTQVRIRPFRMELCVPFHSPFLRYQGLDCFWRSAVAKAWRVS